MGQSCLNNYYNESFTACTLNYSGIMKSPVQYFSQSGYNQEQAMDRIFVQQMSEHELTQSKDFQWKLGEIDQKMQTERYAPFYNPRRGVQNKRLLSNKEFQLKWDQVFKNNASKIKDLKYSPADIKMARTFDLLGYRTFVRYVYKKKLEDVNPTDIYRYLDFTDQLFRKPFMDQSKKIKMTVSYIEKVDLDIIFLQEINSAIIKQINKKGQFLTKQREGSQSAILVRKRVIRGEDRTDEVLKAFTKEQVESFNWNKDTVILCVDKFFLISGHISSKKEKNQTQIEQIKKDLQLITRKLPQYHIVLGMDANNGDFVAPRDYYCFPDKKQMNTVYKKRTHMQVQTKKANTLSNKRSDYIVTNFDIKNGQIRTIQGQPIDNQSFLPSIHHPFDHFLVVVQFSQDMLK